MQSPRHFIGSEKAMVWVNLEVEFEGAFWLELKRKEKGRFFRQGPPTAKHSGGPKAQRPEGGAELPPPGHSSPQAPHGTQSKL